MALCGRSNVLLRKFSNCSFRVKTRLFNAFCNNFYCIQLWCDYKASSIRSLHVCHNNALRRLLDLPRNASISSAFVVNQTDNFPILRRKAVYSFVRRLRFSENELLKSLLHSDAAYFGLQDKWQKLLYSRF